MDGELWWPEGAPLRYMHGFGRYYETHQLVEGQWQLMQMTPTRLHSDLDERHPRTGLRAPGR